MIFKSWLANEKKKKDFYSLNKVKTKYEFEPNILGLRENRVNHYTP